MVYKILYKASVERDLKAIDKTYRLRILNKIENELALNPKELGKPLKGQYKGFWFFRIGEYRVVYKVSVEEILILVLKIGHRKDVYN